MNGYNKPAKLKKIGIVILKSIVAIMMVGMASLPFMPDGLSAIRSPLASTETTQPDTLLTKVFTSEIVETKQAFSLDDLMANIKNFVSTPEGGTPWRVFGETTQHEYSYKDEEGMEWRGVRPEFSEALKKMDGSDILIQGYMFPLGQEEKQPLFLLGPFPVSCPYHYHVTPNLIIEIHAKTPVTFSYDAVNIKGTLELIEQDDEYNIFYRLNNAELAP